MKKFLTRWAIVYSIVNIVFLLVAFVIFRRLNVDVPFLRISAGAIIISFLIASSITIFHAKNLNGVSRTILGFLLILPIMFIAKNLFGVMVFRFSFMIYLLAFLTAVIYAVAVIVVTKKVKSEEKALNEMLMRKKLDIDKENLEDTQEDTINEIEPDGNIFRIDK